MRKKFKVRRRLFEGMTWWTVTDPRGSVAWMFTGASALEIVRRELAMDPVEGVMWLAPGSVPAPRVCASRLMAIADASRAEALPFVGRWAS